MKYLALILALGPVTASLRAQPADPAPAPKVTGLTAELRAATGVDKKIVQTETLRYTINWPSGLSLGEGQLSSTRTKSVEGETVAFTLNMEAGIPGFPVQESVRSNATAGYCSMDIEKDTIRGKKNSKEKTTFDPQKMIATRTTLNGGGKTELSIPACAKDALGYIFFLRRELAQGRLPVTQKVYYGAAYDVRVQYMGTQTIRVADAQMETDRLLGTIKGPASESTVEIFFARDPGRTPVLIRIPLAMGKFSMEIVR